MSVDSDMIMSANYPYLEPIANALPVPPREAQRTINPERLVVARIEWGNSGVETIRTLVYAYAPGMALVRMDDPRWRIAGVWLPGEDVTSV